MTWGPWIDHGGKGFPGPYSTTIEAERADGERLVGMVTHGSGFQHHYNWWLWSCIKPDEWHRRVVRYRIRKPRGLDILEKIVADPQPIADPTPDTPKHPHPVADLTGGCLAGRCLLAASCPFPTPSRARATHTAHGQSPRAPMGPQPHHDTPNAADVAPHRQQAAQAGAPANPPSHPPPPVQLNAPETMKVK